MKPADLLPLTPAFVALVKAIQDKGGDPSVEIPAITRSYEATGRADAAIANYIKQKFPDAK